MSSRGTVLVEMMIVIVIVMMIMILVTKTCKIKNLILSETKSEKHQKTSKIHVTSKDTPQ